MRRYYGIEFLRLLSSLSVLLYHYRYFFSPHTTYSSNDFNDSKMNLPFYSILEVFYNKGFFGVHMFYAISGFVFAYIYLSINEKVFRDHGSGFAETIVKLSKEVTKAREYQYNLI